MIHKRKYCVAFINHTENILPEHLKKMQNLMHYWILEMSIYAKVKVFSYYESALIFARDYNWEHLVIIDIGNDLEINGQFINKLDEFLNDDDVLVGHILDKKERYYELHKQCFYINTKVWKDIGCPDIGHSAKEKICMSPIRSNKNHHDEYTPYWISPSTEYGNYQNLKFGHNLINEYLKAGYNIQSFDKNVRNSKMYCYPRDNDDKIDKLLNFNFQKKFYMFNTENIPHNFLIKNSPIMQFATVCAGLNHLKIIFKNGYTDNTELCFFDWDPFSISVMKAIYQNWSGYNYPQFLKQLVVDLNYQGTLVSDDDYKWNEFVEWFGTEKEFANWFIKMKQTVSIKFMQINILEDNLEELYRFFKNDGLRIFWLSNIFHYKPTSIMYDTIYRAKIQDDIVKHIPEGTIIFSDTATLNQQKVFTTNTYKPQLEISKEYVKGNLE